MTATLRALGYKHASGRWSHPQGRIAAFLGDFIDSGPENRAVIEDVRAMVEAGDAIAIMGNHELNALHYHSEGENWLGTGDGFMRAHDAPNSRQHATFLKEYPVGSAAAQDVMGWFLSLPLFLDLGALRLVHACWDARHIDLVRQRRADGRLRASDLQEVALEDTGFGKAVVNLLKGPEALLPNGGSFLDYYGKARRHVRIKWWVAQGATWREAALSVGDPSQLPDVPIGRDLDISLYGSDVPPVFFGHYKRNGRPEAPDAHNVMCLDYPRHPHAYRWTGAGPLTGEDIVAV